MKNDYFNQRIACTVSHCKFFDDMDKKCSLGTITVLNNSSSETLCANYEKNELQ